MRAIFFFRRWRAWQPTKVPVEEKNERGGRGRSCAWPHADWWLSADEIGKHIGVSSDTGYRSSDKYAMPAHRMDRLCKFKKDEVDERLKAGAAEPVEGDKKCEE